MHMSDTWIAVVRIKLLEIYIHDGSGYTFWKEMFFEHPIDSAYFTKVSDNHCARPSISLKLCITCADGLFVYELRCKPECDSLSLELIWNKDPPRICNHAALSQGRLGVTGRNVSWIQGDYAPSGEPVRFASARLSIGEEIKGGKAHPGYFAHLDHIPALYSLGVYEHDEARGISVFGSAYGELTLYDFSHSDPHQMEECLRSILMAAPHVDAKLSPTACKLVCLVCLILTSQFKHEIPSYPGPPFPNWEIPDHVKSDTFGYWKANRFATPPPGWATDCEGTCANGHTWYGFFSGHIRKCTIHIWDLEHSSHYYGKPLPVIHKEINGNSFAICRIGGLLFILSSANEYFYAVDPGTTIEEIVVYLEGGNGQAYVIPRDDAQCARGGWFHSSMRWVCAREKQV